MKTHDNEYTQRVDAWLRERGIAARITPIGQELGFPNESDGNRMFHDTYRAEFSRKVGERPVTFIVPKFYQSAAYSESAIGTAARKCISRYIQCGTVSAHAAACPASPARTFAPTAYDVLACVTKYDPGTFKEFVSDFGYGMDSIKAREIYLAVQEEWRQARAFFTAEELDELADIAN